MKKKVTIQDIADELGISRNTVSKAINNSEGLAEATRDRILQKAIEMGYKQFSYVGTLMNGVLPSRPEAPEYQGEVALLTNSFLTNSHFASTMLDKFQREISQLGYTLNSHRVTDDNLRTMTLPITFRRDQVRAVICIEMFDRPYGEMICELGIPVLFVDGPVKKDGVSLPCDQLYMDNTTASATTTRAATSSSWRGWGNCRTYSSAPTTSLPGSWSADSSPSENPCRRTCAFSASTTRRSHASDVPR